MTKMTKAQLVDENIRLRAQCDVLERKCQELGAGHARARSPVRGAVQNTDRASYYRYVSECRRIQRERGARTVSYLSYNDWVANITARDEVYA